MAQIIDGKAIAAEIRAGLAREVADFTRAVGRPPGLAVVLVGDDPASRVYVSNKQKACAQVGIHSVRRDLPAEVTTADVQALARELNEASDIDGILVQLPLPRQVDVQAVIEAVDPAKDVDGFHPVNVGRLAAGVPGLVPCTPAGVMELLARAQVPVEGRRAVVVGRSRIVGLPAALLLLRANATVTICHSRTPDLGAQCRQADILVVAVGRPRFVPGDWVKPGAAVIDVGTNRLPDGKLVGDVDFAGAQAVAGWLTPVPGGVGPMTIAMLLRNTLQAARQRAGLGPTLATSGPARG